MLKKKQICEKIGFEGLVSIKGRTYLDKPAAESSRFGNLHTSSFSYKIKT